MDCVFKGCFGFLAKKSNVVHAMGQGDDIYAKAYTELSGYQKPKLSLWSTIKSFFTRKSNMKTVSDVIAPVHQLIPEAPPLEVGLTDAMRDIWDEVVSSMRAAPNVNVEASHLSRSSSCSSLTSVTHMSDFASDTTSIWGSDIECDQCSLADVESITDSPLSDWEDSWE